MNRRGGVGGVARAVNERSPYGVASSPAVYHGLVFFGGLDGTFYAFRTDD